MNFQGSKPWNTKN